MSSLDVSTPTRGYYDECRPVLSKRCSMSPEGDSGAKRRGSIRSEKSEQTSGSTFYKQVRSTEIEQLRSFCLSKNTKTKVVLALGQPGTGKTSSIENTLSELTLNEKSLNVVSFHASNFKGDNTCSWNDAPGINAFLLELFMIAMPDATSSQVREFSSANSVLVKLELLSKLTNEGSDFIIFIDEIDMAYTIRINRTAIASSDSRLTVLEFLIIIFTRYLQKGRLLAASNEAEIVTPLEHYLNNLSKQENNSNENSVSDTKTSTSSFYEVINFTPYSYQQLIAVARNYGCDIAAQVGLEFGIRKIASNYGDCRRVMDLISRCKSSAEHHTDVTIDHVQSILGDEYSSTIQQICTATSQLPLSTQTIIAAIFIYVSHTEKNQRIAVSDLYCVYSKLCTDLRYPKIQVAEFLDELFSLNATSIIQFKKEARQIDSLSPTVRTPPRGKRTPLTRRPPPSVTSSGEPTREISILSFPLNKKQVSLAHRKLANEPGLFKQIELLH